MVGARGRSKWLRRAALRAATALGYEVRRSPADGRLSVRRHLRLAGDPFAAMRTILRGRADCILDVGAHEGETALRLASAFPGSAVYSFEPDPDNFDALVRNTRARPGVVSVRKAVAETTGSATFHRTRFSQTHSLLKPRADVSEFLESPELLAPADPLVVETVTLDAFCSERGLRAVDILKVDAQGSELSVLRGAERLLRERAISLLYLEVNFVPFYEGTPLFPDVYEFVYQRGFRFVGLYETGSARHYYPAGGNALFVEQERGRLPRLDR